MPETVLDLLLAARVLMQQQLDDLDFLIRNREPSKRASPKFREHKGSLSSELRKAVPKILKEHAPLLPRVLLRYLKDEGIEVGGKHLRSWLAEEKKKGQLINGEHREGWSLRIIEEEPLPDITCNEQTVHSTGG